MIIRAANSEDAAAITAIWNPIIDDSAATFTNLRKTPEGLQADIAARGPAFLVAEEDGLLLGFATFFPFRGGPGYAQTKEHTVILGPAARGRGVGRALMTALIEEARGQGVHSLFAGVSGENDAGVAFHAALGFREVARLPEVGFKFGRWMDLVLMQKFL
ncbi:GNAT family acetyltransferase [Salipiger sp. CCB-MM3]|uniref:GNAT family N-acetyltransferase n=1 Tax=Salipiger sp. CCB-MM3 TaxID=1792508 RepID=UPI00080AA81D|nr:GNAT family N-acetyltransferase [Salipiger sp. CCB-MM3]ANT62081.1 GNAT family acetyltransferase [Salipiger sp. CCB-MM3]